MGAARGAPAAGRPSLSSATGTRAAPLLLLLAAVVSVPAVTSGQQAAPAEIHAIRFEGNDHLDDGALRSRMRLRQSVWWNPFRSTRYLGPDFLASDLRAVIEAYQEEGYPFARILEALVAYNAAEDSVGITIRVEEGPRIWMSRISWPGLESWDKDLRSKAPLRPGDPLSLPLLRADLDRVARVAYERGRPLAWSDFQTRYAGDSAEVVVHVDPGPQVHVGEIVIEGLENSREKLVTRELTLRSGDLLTAKRVQESQDRLLGTGVLSRARIRPEFPDSSIPTARLRVNVQERKPGWVGVGAGYSSSDRLRFVTEWGRRNLGGMGRQVRFTGHLYYSLDPDFRGGGLQFREGQVQVDFLEPWLIGTRTRGLVSPYVRWLQEAAFHQRTIGYPVSLGRDLNRYTRSSISVETKHVSTTEPGVIPEYTTRFMTLDLIEDRRDNIFDPSRGRYLQGTAEYAGGFLGGINEFTRFTASWQGYTGLQDRWIVAARLKAGLIEPIGGGPTFDAPSDTLELSRIPWEERYRLGGGNTVRGYSEGMLGRRNEEGSAIGGLVLFLASAELRFPLAWIFQGSIFLDAGNVWADPSELTLDRFSNGLRVRSYDPLNVAYGMGLGLRIRTPVGPFRFDYGFKLGSGRAPGDPAGNLHVALGQAF